MTTKVKHLKQTKQELNQTAMMVEYFHPYLFKREMLVFTRQV